MTMLLRRWNAESISLLPPRERQAILRNLNEEERQTAVASWPFWARAAQKPPLGDWRIWLFLAGRGAGKTRAGAEWIAHGVCHGEMRRIGLVGATFHDARSVMIEGESGLLGVAPGAAFEPSNRRVLWPNGAVASVISAEEPDYVRGHQFDAVWADEFCKWAQPQAALDMVLMALRLGEDPRMAVTTTPRNIAPLKNLMTASDTAKTHATARDNAANLAPTFLAGLELRFAGTRLGRQELDGEVIEDNDAALWQRIWIERARVRKAPPLIRVVVAVDPPASIAGDECGIVVAGIASDGAGYVIADRSVAGMTPAGWAARVADAYETFEADSIVAEANQGGDMVRQVLLEPLAQRGGETGPRHARQAHPRHACRRALRTTPRASRGNIPRARRSALHL